MFNNLVVRSLNIVSASPYIPAAAGTSKGVTLPLAESTQAGTVAAPTPTSLWRFDAPVGDTHGPFQSFVGGAFFVDTFDRVIYWGYNAADGGGNAVGTEPKLSVQIESDFNDGVQHNIEFYWEYAKGSGASGPTTYRPWFVQINRANGSVTSYQLNSTTGFSFNTTDGLATQWGTLSPTGLNVTPRAGQSCSLSLAWVTGGQNNISVGNGTLGFLLQPVTAGNQPWQILIGGVASLNLTNHGLQTGDPNVSNNGVLQSTPSVADKDSKYNLYLQAQAAQSIQLVVARASDGTTNLWYSNVDGTFLFGVNGQSTVVGKLLANAATDGFLYLPTVAGTPTGTPTTRTGTAPFVYDTTAHKIWVYDAGWKGVVVA